jgi:hypothetical protein
MDQPMERSTVVRAGAAATLSLQNDFPDHHCFVIRKMHDNQWPEEKVQRKTSASVQ